jgi:thymidylate synthase
LYGFQWRHFGAPFPLSGDKKGVDQLAEVLRLLKEEPTSRRIILSAWNPADLDQMALPPCHVLSQFYVEGKYLSCHLYQRSADIGLGLPFNIGSYALLTYLLAHFTGLIPKRLIISLGDAHIYRNAIEPLRKQLSREPYPFPKLRIVGNPKDLFSVKFEHLLLENYRCHPSIGIKMVV